MHYFIVFAKLLDPKGASGIASAHMAYMIGLREAGTVFAHGRLLDGWGGVAVYRAESIEEVQELVSKDPFIIHGIRAADIHEWDMKLAPGVSIA